MTFGDYSCFSFVDVETTGTSASQDRVLEIGIIRVENGEIVGELNTLVDAGVYIPPEITTITGITENDILNAPTFPDIADKVSKLLKDSVFVAHNARFDHAFIRHEFRRLSQPFNPKTLDTVKLTRRLFPGLPHYNLDSIINLLGVTIEHRHRAYDDAYVLYELLKRINQNFDTRHTIPVFTEFLKTPSLPQQISKNQIELLPESPGVYLMYGSNDTLLYIGKSVDVRARVLSHFYNDFNSSTDLKLNREVTRVEAIETAGDLGASLLESSLIKKYQPIYNKALRHSLDLLAAIHEKKNGYFTVELKALKETKTPQKILGVYRSKRQATEDLREIAKEHKLCLKLLNLEHGSGPCFNSQIEQCNGACTGKEPAFKYNVRFVEAFSERRIKDWPFNGPIGIKEKFVSDMNRVELEEIHVVDNWCYLGSLKNETDEVEYKDMEFNWDNYKILKRFLKKPQVLQSVISFQNFPSHSFPTKLL